MSFLKNLRVTLCPEGNLIVIVDVVAASSAGSSKKRFLSSSSYFCFSRRAYSAFCLSSASCFAFNASSSCSFWSFCLSFSYSACRISSYCKAFSYSFFCCLSKSASAVSAACRYCEMCVPMFWVNYCIKS